MAYTNQQISDRLRQAYEIQSRIAAMRLKRINEACKLAGLGSMGCQLHNSLVSMHSGRPWREVNYHYARKADWLCNTQFKSGKVIARFYTRMVAEQRTAAAKGSTR